MLYDYECDKCGHTMQDVYQSIKDDAFTQCPQCLKHSLNRIIHGGVYVTVKDVKTIGQLADKNWNNLGHYKKSELSAQASEKERANMSALSHAGSASKKEITKMTDSQRERYIITGEK